MKKYDSYNPRVGQVNSRTRTTILSPVQNKAPQSPLISRTTNLSAPKISSPAVQETPLARLPLQQTKQSSVITTNRPSKTRHTRDNTIALNAVHRSKLPEESGPYPDENISVYASGKRKLSLLQKTMYGFGVTVFIFSLLVSIQSFVTNNEAKEQIATLGENITKDEQGVSEGTSDEPSEEHIPESAILSFMPSNPEDPRYLRIPDINVFSRIKSLGVTPGGAVDTPKNIYDTGWYNEGARPGNAVGSSLILGHVSGWTGPGVFKNVNKLAVGAKFEIEKGTGEKINYEVTRTEQVVAIEVDMSKILATEVAGEHDIKLMTCSGKYNKETKSFEDRFIVYGKQIK